MATITRIEGKPTTPGEIRWYPEAASQSFKKGQFVYLSSGKLTVCGAAPTYVAGMAMADASGTTDTAIPITLAKRGQQFTLHCTGTTTVADLGKQYAMSVSSNKCYVNQSATAVSTFVIDAISTENTVGDTYGKYVVEVRGIRAQLDQTTS